ncbi:MAG: GatB/YqeY domain-containing protein [Betaproteobacteria bacterium]|nr:GatB/YqeY domain-containing protein [Betaproteobacteria bacterium]
MTLKDRITEDMKAAMRAKDGQRLSAVRLLLAAMKQREVDERVELADADVLSIIDRMVKQRRESIAHYQKAARADLAAQEQFEIGVLSAYLPQQLSEAQIAAAVAAAIAESGAASVRDMGKAMALLKPRLAGKADMGRVSALLKSRLPA